MQHEVYMAMLIRRELPMRTLVALGKVRGSCVRAAIGVYEVVAEWRRRVRMRNELLTLSDFDFRDMGCTRDWANAECRKPFWRA
jgi:uncharacterized protein YjiS (DUF1127 family)